MIYPSAGLYLSRSYTGERELEIACIRAYNDWIHEFSSVCPERLVGMPMAPTSGVEDMIEEWRRATVLVERTWQEVPTKLRTGLQKPPRD